LTVNDPAKPQGIPAHDSLRAIIQDKQDSNLLWMGGFMGTGLIRFDKATEKFTLYPAEPTNPKGLHSGEIFGLYQDDAGIIWISTSGVGLERFDPRSETFSHYEHDQKDPVSIGSNQIWDIKEFTPGTLWIATVGGGLEKFDKRANTFTHYNKATGFPVNTILTIRRYEKSGDFWMGTDEGLLRFNPENGKTRLYTKEDGLQGNVFIDQGAAIMPDGEMWFGGTAGLSRFYPDHVVDNPYIPPVVLTALKQSGEPMQLSAAPEKLRELRLDWRHNFFEFEFAALNYTLPEKNRYKYKLEGLDQDWYDAGAKRYARYVGLPDGAYTLRVIGSNNDGVWNEQGTSLKIIVVPPYWRTWWFYGLCALASAGVIGFVYRTQVKIQTEAALHHAAEREKIAAQREKEAANAANTAKSQFLSNMSHELRTPLNGILGYAQILTRDRSLTAVQKDGLNIIYQSGNHLLTLINDILDLAKVEAGKLDLVPARFHFRSFLDGIAGIIRMRAEQKNLLFELQTATPLPEGVIADEKRLRQVLLNLLGNAVKFTKAGKVILQVSVLRSRQSDAASSTDAPHVALIRFEVIDTGVGMTAESVGKLFKPFEQVGDAQSRAEGTGLGLAISRRLVQLMGGDIEIKSAPGVGTTFWFELELAAAAVALRDVQQRRQQDVTGYAGTRRKILIADDKLSNRLVMVHLLEPLGFELDLAEDGQQLVAKAQEFRPDAILTDLVMPVMTGFEAAQQIRRIPELRDVVIIAVSASVFEMDKEQSKIAGCDDFLSKPVVASQLFDLLGTHLHLEWSYEDDLAETSDAAATAPDAEAIVLPAREELAQLYDVVMAGVLDEMLAAVMRLEQRDPAYAPFVRKVTAFVQQYQDEELLAYLEQYLSA